MGYSGLILQLRRKNMTYEEEKEMNKDHVATPKWIVERIYELIDIRSFKNCWLPFDNYDSEFKITAEELGLKYWATHLFDGNKNDFFKTTPSHSFDLMISNPPFSKQNDILKRSFQLAEEGKIKSFAWLLPLTTLETERRASMFETHIEDLTIVIFKKRIKFLGHTSIFNKCCCWVCYRIPALKDKKIIWI